MDPASLEGAWPAPLCWTDTGCALWRSPRPLFRNPWVHTRVESPRPGASSHCEAQAASSFSCLTSALGTQEAGARAGEGLCQHHRGRGEWTAPPTLPCPRGTHRPSHEHSLSFLPAGRRAEATPPWRSGSGPLVCLVSAFLWYLKRSCSWWIRFTYDESFTDNTFFSTNCCL